MSILYKSTSTKRYMWGIGIVCALLFLLITGFWMTEGKMPYHFSGFGAETNGVVTKEDNSVLFWAIIMVAFSTGVTALIVTARGLRRIQSVDEAQES